MQTGKQTVVGNVVDLSGPPPSERQIRKAAGQVFYTLWRQGVDAPMGLYCRSREQAKDFLLQLPEKYHDQFDIVKVHVLG